MKWNWFEDGKWKVCPFTRCEAVRSQMPLLPKRFYVRDVTLKEGSDVPGAHFSLEGTVELVPLSSERYFVKSAGPEIEVQFSPAKDKDGHPESLLLKIGDQEIPAKRK